MNESWKKCIEDIVTDITGNYENEPLFSTKKGIHLPNRNVIIEIIKELRRVIFPGYFEDDNIAGTLPEYFVGETLSRIHDKLKMQITAALLYQNDKQRTEEEIGIQAEEICIHFFKQLGTIQRMLLKDVQAGFDGDPAAKSKAEVIFSYPGLFAIYVYRIAHVLYEMNVPFIPRIMTEYAHGCTGIDINSGAVIGEYFFIDHGTGVVIGETTVIGNNVKLYQGVTLGALSTRSGQQLAGVKRHPTIENGVTIYSGSTILGGNTIIGEESIIGGNAFIISSVPPRTRVSVKNPELTFKGQQKKESQEYIWDWVI